MYNQGAPWESDRIPNIANHMTTGGKTLAKGADARPSDPHGSEETEIDADWEPIEHSDYEILEVPACHAKEEKEESHLQEEKAGCSTPCKCHSSPSASKATPLLQGLCRDQTLSKEQ